MKFFQYKEIKQRGSPSFPVQYYYVDKSHPHYVMPLHWQDSFEIVRVIKGRLQLYLDNELFIGEPGAVFFIAPSVLHRAEPIDCIYECLVFEMKVINTYESSRLSEYIAPIATSDMQVDAMCSSAKETADELFRAVCIESEYFEIYLVSLIYKLFYELYSGGCIRYTKQKSRAYLHRRAQMVVLLDKLNREFTNDISVSELAEICSIHKEHLSVVFKGYTGCTITEYINRLRIDHAAYLMTVKSMPVTDAAYESGFNDLSHFSKTFKKYRGMSPREYVKLQRSPKSNSKASDLGEAI